MGLRESTEKTAIKEMGSEIMELYHGDIWKPKAKTADLTLKKKLRSLWRVLSRRVLRFDLYT